VLSPSNTPAKVNRQRIIAMSAGSEEFWVVDPATRTVQVTNLRSTQVYTAAEVIPLALFNGSLAVSRIFGA
jgi:Uma2 family endonuclease